MNKNDINNFDKKFDVFAYIVEVNPLSLDYKFALVLAKGLVNEYGITEEEWDFMRAHMHEYHEDHMRRSIKAGNSPELLGFHKFYDYSTGLEIYEFDRPIDRRDGDSRDWREEWRLSRYKILGPTTSDETWDAIETLSPKYGIVLDYDSQMGKNARLNGQTTSEIKGRYLYSEEDYSLIVNPDRTGLQYTVLFNRMEDLKKLDSPARRFLRKLKVAVDFLK